MPDGAAFRKPDYQGRDRYSYGLQQINDIAHLADRPSDDDVEHIRALYDGGVRAFDREVGRLLAQLDADGVTDRIVIVAGDHGESLFEPGATTEHGKFSSQVGRPRCGRTTMLVVGTGVPKGDVIGVRSGVDFAPTLLRLLHVAAPPMDGVSLFEPLPPNRTVFAETTTWLGGSADRPPNTILYPPIIDLLEPEQGSHALVMRRRYSDIAVTAKMREARQGPWQLIYTPTPDGTEFQLFNLDTDPFEQHDILNDHPAVADDLKHRLYDWMEQDPIRWFDGRHHLVARRER